MKQPTWNGARKFPLFMLIGVTGLLGVMGLTACSGSSRDRDPDEMLAADHARGSTSSSADALPVPELNIGDVEAMIRMSLKAPAEQFPPTAEVEPMETRKGHLAAWYVTLKPPYPQAIQVTLDLTVLREFTERPVILEIELLRDDQPIGVPWRTLVTRHVLQPGTDAPDGPRSFQADVMQGLATPPESMLIVARARAVLAPKGTDPVLLDWQHFDLNSVPAEDRTVIYSNPARITFAATS
ncbi:MAG: hypothetical protein KBH78_12355 [Candidatus Hydrogenedentes bacterium]|nr:hypothetical protein [Candidatus Hydrogenedentota bacterium]